MDLYEIFASIPGIREIIFTYFDKYEDNIFIFRMLSKSFWSLHLYDKFTVEKIYKKNGYCNQSINMIINFLKYNKVRTFYINSYNKKITQIDPKYLTCLKKLVIDDVPKENHFYFLMRYFANFPIENLKLKYLNIVYSDILLQFRKLKTLDITITTKENEQIIFDLLLVNKETLNKLKIGIYTGKGIDEKKLVEIIENNLQLEYIDIRSDLTTPKMILPKTRIIVNSFVYKNEFLLKLKYLKILRIHSLKNNDLNILLGQLELIESVSLRGDTNNYETFKEEDEIKYPFLFSSSLFDHIIPYDGSSAQINIKSPYLNHMYLYGFTIDKFQLKNVDNFQYFYIEDVCFKCNIYLPKLVEFTVENYIMNPHNFDIKFFKMPQLKSINLHHVILSKFFVFHKLKSMNIQNSIIDINLNLLILKNKNIKYYLLFHNSFECLQDIEKLKYFSDKNKIRYDINDQ